MSEISGDFVQFSPQKKSFHNIFSVHFHHVFTTFTPEDIFTTSFHYIFTTKGQIDRDEQTPWGHTDRFLPQIFTTNSHHRFSPQMFTTNLHHRFSPQISLSRECDLGDKQTKINLETVASSNILIHSPGNSVEIGCTNKFSPHVV